MIRKIYDPVMDRERALRLDAEDARRASGGEASE